MKRVNDYLKSSNKVVLSKKVAPVLVLMASSMLAFGLMATGPELEVKPVKKILPVVRIKTVEPSRETLLVYSEGVLSPSAESTLVPEVDGRVVWVNPNFKAGGYFSEGEELFRIDGLDYRSEYENARARLDKALVEFEFSESEFNRSKVLNKKNLISASSFDDIFRRFHMSSAEAKLARLTLEQAERNLSRTIIKAPYSGRVRSEKVEFGQFVRRGDMVAEIYADQVIKVRLPVPNRQMAFLGDPGVAGGFTESKSLSDPKSKQAKGLPVVNFSVEYAGRLYQWQGRLVRHEAELDEQSRMIYGIAEMTRNELPANLPMGLFVKAEIEGRSMENLVRLHRGAIRHGSEVVVVDKNSRLRVRPVTVLRHQGDESIISSGLNKGDKVCVSPVTIVVEGMQVETLDDGENPLEMVSDVISEREASEPRMSERKVSVASEDLM
ncbi:efflux RND transporter periplasmic adaptor subunit [Aestuariicella hydrocarbonica]|uniref:Efflux RND transporter periplasmic adaptor subunit n=1 Tax=Pseudomaricurvus hydrocarbonicus TaxID=1470433 RepID=A0A9E5MM61_9GAMM|nr:efflux RND transporter periplasmic adaptor subunit [Aestuariicella hydrocarbonica]